MTDADLTTLALGTDLTSLGLALNSPEPVHRTFASPWADAPGRPDPPSLSASSRLGGGPVSPPCYLHVPPPIAPGHFARFALETLFYCFYAMPGDEAQLFAADELSRRGWTFHKEYRVWVARAPGAAEPSAKTATSERGSYLVFDAASWETVRKDGFVLHYDALERPPNLATVARGGTAPAQAPAPLQMPPQQQQQQQVGGPLPQRP